MTATTRACPSCRTPLPEEAHFCFQCGTATPPEPGVPARKAATSSRELDRVRTALAGRGYTVDRVIGEGGMATVYLATDQKHHRQVALKVMRPELAATLGAERFLREVEIASQLNHPHILPVYDSGDADGVLFYVMPYIEGESLHDKLRRERQLPVEEALRIAREVTEALAHAHGKKIVHRDIKPANIMLSAGHALVADFGIARAVGVSGGASITRTGLAVGTPQYMSPEQASGSPDLDARSDIYSVGAMLYEMLVGEPPFTGPTAAAIVIRSLTEPHRKLTRAREGISPIIDELVDRALAKNAADRWQTASDFAHALNATGEQLRYAPISGAQTPPAIATVSSGRSSRKVWSLVAITATLVLALVLGLVYRAKAAASSKHSVVRLAVLPFENRGAAEDGYFVDGVADQVRGKLTGVGGFEVIARASSNQYRESKKTLREVGRELEVDYLLTSTVHWAKTADGKGRVRVIPELIDVKTGASRWQQSFDAELTDIFEVQGTIAAQVAGALNVALAPKEQEVLAERPTKSLEAYDSFLKGNAVSGNSPAELRKAVDFYRQAVTLDPTFAQAWHKMGLRLASLYFNGTPTPEVAAKAKYAVDQLNAVAPGSALALSAGSWYKYFVVRDAPGAIEDGMAALRLAPNDASMLRMAASLETILGRWSDALAHAESATRLDPKSTNTKTGLIQILLPMRKYAEAIALLTQLMADDPTVTSLQTLALAYLMQGNLVSAREVLAAPPPGVTREQLVAYLGLYNDLYWMLDEKDQKLLLTLGPEHFDGDRASWAETIMQLHYLRGDRALARAFADTARIEYQNQLARVPEDPQRNLFLGLALATLGRKAEAIAAAERGDQFQPLEKDQNNGPYMRHQLIRVYLVLGENDKALDLLENLVKIPYYLTPQYLSIDPNFAQLRGNPRFEKLLRE